MIDYKILSEAVDHYKLHGYKYIDVPWTIPEQVSRITAPEWVNLNTLKHNGKSLVGSGEQSFIYMMIKGQLPPGKYQTITPCFRDERVDELHLKSFMKLELINTYDISPEGGLACMISHAEQFNTKYFNEEDLMKMITEDGYDLTYIKDGDTISNYIELGSYGIRSHKHLSWVYGTGVAEPRFSNVLKQVSYGIPQGGDTQGDFRLY